MGAQPLQECALPGTLIEATRGVPHSVSFKAVLGCVAATACSGSYPSVASFIWYAMLLVWFVQLGPFLAACVPVGVVLICQISGCCSVGSKDVGKGGEGTPTPCTPMGRPGATCGCASVNCCVIPRIKDKHEPHSRRVRVAAVGAVAFVLNLQVQYSEVQLVNLVCLGK